MRRTLIPNLLLTSSLLFTGGCFLLSEPGRKEYKDVTKEHCADNTQLITRFNDYPIEKRIDMFLYADDPRLLPILSLGGKDIVPHVMARIEKPDLHIWSKVRLMDVLLNINRTCKCIGSDETLMLRLESASQSLESSRFVDADDSRKEIFKEQITILKDQLKLPPTNSR